MTAYKELADYLRTKVSKVNPNNPKANTGAVLLKLFKQFDVEAESLVMLAISTLELNLKQHSSNSPAGESTLTNSSATIGKRVSKHIQREPLPWHVQIRLGDLFIEALYNCEFIDLTYERTSNSQHKINVLEKWATLAEIPESLKKFTINGTAIRKPKNIYNVFQSYHTIANIHKEQSIIKNWSEEDNARFVKNLGTPWVNSIDNVQQVGWSINKRVLKAIKANEESFISLEKVEDNDAKEQKRLSKLVEFSFITTKAEVLKDKSAFYQYIEADYRGRLYYTESFLNFQGSDLARGMLKFARAKPMNESGKQWLAIHTANSFNQSFGIDEIPEWCESDYKSHLESEGLESISVDKMTLEDRIRWTNNNMETILTAGEHNMFIEGAEKEVTTLACCLEWYDMSICEGTYYSRLPIPIDGSNNGWQHLGAISKDPKTGDLVGLIPREIQQDFYVQTAKELYHNTKDERRKEILHNMPMKHIRKGVSKRGSMTRAYSAGAQKIAENMYFDCKSEDFHEKYDITEKDCLGFARDLIKAINIVCPGPLSTMEYLQGLAKYEIGEYEKQKDGKSAATEWKNLRAQLKALYMTEEKSEEVLQQINDLVLELQKFETVKIKGNGSKSIFWTTPSKFPVRYDCYVMTECKTIGTISGYTKYNKRGTVNHSGLVASQAPDVRGFMCGISPNFIHSMDASHMSMVINDWHGDFGAVHDSFSTHACDVDDLLELTKSTFINMYNVENFYDYIENQLITNKDDLDVEQPIRGSLNVEDIYQSDYFFA